MPDSGGWGAAYDREAALEFMRVANGRSGESWEDRCVAVLLLENQLLRVPADEFGEVVSGLGLENSDHLQRRLGRLNRVHRNASQSYFMRAAQDISKLYLARYFFTVDEVVERISTTLRVSQGAPTAVQPFVDSGMPAYEAAILQRLCAGNPIYWTSDRCGSELNAMVEYPLTTAVVVIKPPGSDVEFEIKRAGTRGPRLLNVISHKNGKDAPTSHRLFGGSLGWLAEREASSSARFSAIYRLVHGTDSPSSHTASVSAVVTTPTGEGEVHLLDYLTDGETFGAGFDEMRSAMATCVTAFPSDTGVPRASYSGEGGATLQFIGQALPQQAIITGSSSFRLDRIALYLSRAGASEYFGERVASEGDLRWMADSVLEEILGEVIPPSGDFASYEQYVEDAFVVAANRDRADRNYESVMRQMGECWGTLLALRGYSDGESFVQRNVGLKSVWCNDDWEIRIIFMDHDDLTFAGSRYPYSWPSREVPGMTRDEVHLLGGPLSGEHIPGDVGALQRIYRTSNEVGEAGVAELRDSLRAAYRKTQLAIDANVELQGFFYPEFRHRHRDLDWLVTRCLACDSSQPDAWKAEAVAYLNEKGYGEELAGESIQAVSQFRGFFERLSFIYLR